jgi:hypothetical protein
VVSFEDFRSWALALPDVAEGTTYHDSPVFRLRKKFLARLRVEHDEPDILVLRLFDEVEKEMLLETQPETFFITDHYRGYPAVLIRLKYVEPAHLQDLLERAWRHLAPKRLAAQHPGIGA